LTLATVDGDTSGHVERYVRKQPSLVVAHALPEGVGAGRLSFTDFCQSRTHLRPTPVMGFF
jgi:hypothetical protein